MTRSKLRRTQRRLYFLISSILIISLIAKLAEHIPMLAGSGIEKILKDIYEVVKDMALLIATGGVAYISNTYQKRQAFLDNLKTEWREIIGAKSAVLKFMHNPSPSHTEFVAAQTQLSEAIDNMRIVYRNVGENSELIGLYPFAPLHDMRRVLQTLDPRNGPTSDEQRKLARDTMLQSFYGLRDRFLDELELEEPDSPILMAGKRRLRATGTTKAARKAQDAEIADQHQKHPEQDASDELLQSLYQSEEQRRPATKQAPEK